MKKPRQGAARGMQAAADELQLSREVLGHLPSGVVLFNRSGRVEEANPAARAALGFAQPRGLTAAKLLRGAELRESDGTLLGRAAPLALGLLRSERILQRKTMLYTTPEGEGRRLGVTMFPLRTAAELPPAGLVCLLTDLTAIHALEEELQRRRSLSALGEMAAGIAHEFRNGLAIISGYGQLLERGAGEPGRGQAGKILEQTALLNSIATEFLAFARPLPLQMDAVALQPLLEECAEAIGVQSYPRVRVRIGKRMPRVRGDRILLRSAFLNLMRNACESISETERGGQVSVRAKGDGAGQVRVEVEDDGPGVPREVREKIFIPFFTTKARGTGLGLAMVHKIVTAHHGSVLLADATAGHTVFEVLLPNAR